jgi:hypothetical protein
VLADDVLVVDVLVVEVPVVVAADVTGDGPLPLPPLEQAAVIKTARSAMRRRAGESAGVMEIVLRLGCAVERRRGMHHGRGAWAPASRRPGFAVTAASNSYYFPSKGAFWPKCRLDLR